MTEVMGLAFGGGQERWWAPASSNDWSRWVLLWLVVQVQCCPVFAADWHWHCASNHEDEDAEYGRFEWHCLRLQMLARPSTPSAIQCTEWVGEWGGDGCDFAVQSPPERHHREVDVLKLQFPAADAPPSLSALVRVFCTDCQSLNQTVRLKAVALKLLSSWE